MVRLGPVLPGAILVWLHGAERQRRARARDTRRLSFWLLLLVAAAFAGLCGVIIGAPTLRLRGDYLAIVTLGFGEIVPASSRTGSKHGGFSLTNGTIGIKAIDAPGLQFLPDSLPGSGNS